MELQKHMTLTRTKLLKQPNTNVLKCNINKGTNIGILHSLILCISGNMTSWFPLFNIVLTNS